ncbi:hypothetical protein [Brevundimonas balnearis]|uniref:HIG1 domain-containing protein n=1 Tax=Brevundimonas balnearis TaxID=1572858 RepID=A0ABV6R529_9CAUL
MALAPTIVLFLASLALTLFAGWRGARPPDLRRGVRMVPWRLVMVLSAAVTFFALVHLAALGGLPTR